MAAVHFTTEYLANQTKPTGHVERYGLMAVVATLTALLLSSLNDLQFFVVFLYAASGSIFKTSVTSFPYTDRP